MPQCISPCAIASSSRSSQLFPFPVARFLTLALEVAALPENQLERALVLAASLPKSIYDVKPPALKKAQAPFFQALAKRFAGLDAFLKAVNLSKVFADPPVDCRNNRITRLPDLHNWLEEILATGNVFACIEGLPPGCTSDLPACEV